MQELHIKKEIQLGDCWRIERVRGVLESYTQKK